MVPQPASDATTLERDSPALTVVIPTRDRGGSVIQTLRSVLAQSYRHFEVRIVDQSRDERTATALASQPGDGRVHYLRSSTTGLSTALNIGIGHAASELIAVTGDDCEAASGWLDALVAAFANDPRIGVVFGNVLPVAHDSGQGFVQAYVRQGGALARNLREKHRVGGTSSNMGVRRTTWLALHGFDAMLGVGAPLQAAEETDLALRALRAGYFVCETPHAAVAHHGFLPRAERARLIHRNWYGTGAAFAKLVKCDPSAMVTAIPRLALGWAASSSGVAASLDRSPHRAERLGAFARGFLAGLLMRVDRTNGHFVPRLRVPLHINASAFATLPKPPGRRGRHRRLR